ncbi:ribonuclease HII [Hyphococcus luteus]|uniref:Ribonuclease HII n=1 Tax=Hyphococcus luteus TaxID=2058213 RepID=A0A2S7K5L2_9PROT|nr:ribonuclease HII [Marinicaulis flavus]PQA87738.1 ribonuclease HII [Marinicaulis flavus]
MAVIKPTYDLETAHAHAGPVAGIDEAGRGPWAGPVVAAAVILDPDDIPDGLADSKKLSETRREKIALSIRERALVSVGVASVEEIDEINILQATFLAMARAEEGLADRPATCIVDGSQKPKLKAATQMVVKGDATSLSIAAASIIAKTVRDDMMRALALDHPFYAWEKNKGYGAPAHREGLARYGVTPHHRKSFAPIHKILCENA